LLEDLHCQGMRVYTALGDLARRNKILVGR
jgi:hypothetical protein